MFSHPLSPQQINFLDLVLREKYLKICCNLQFTGKPNTVLTAVIIKAVGMTVLFAHRNVEPNCSSLTTFK